ncbi:uncharacterized protein Z520_01284 [Fonsecaea multimorphosa CBS 102226]|uniref:Uncharacterized protein n=1 Tax=Fonsecaea multimorphosa CBS 102226 TaxID=1442371 RepID=A0A0D2L1A4_9EURO|nr:uncharacterized protein Z520_01284 [Fonsecaea multimorphosa CBS 102226]KIY02819.1 hypothetical protein Z520_01284 [Fonsecaea multimorphosa CBS 102226]OAL30984.1 hypothetical protein AYO22_01279 [Fonsecaea multimorphosa]
MSMSTSTAPSTSTSASSSAQTATSRQRQREPKRFAPLNPNAEEGHGLPKLKGIIFDMDGTLCLPQNYMFREMREALGIPRSVDILDHIRSLSNEPDNPAAASSSDFGPEPGLGQHPHSTINPFQLPSEEMLSPFSDKIPDPPPLSPQARAVGKIQAIERNAMSSQRPQPGLQALMDYLTRRGVRKALCTRNFPAPVHHLLSNYLPEEKFDPIITRETEGVEPKPSPEGLWMIAQSWGLDKDIETGEVQQSVQNVGGELDPLELARRYLGSGLIMVGDSIDDMAAGWRAGAATVLLAQDENQELVKHEYTGLSIRRLDELIDILENGFAESAET